MRADECNATLAERGWLVLDLQDPGPVFAVRQRLLDWLRQELPELESLDEYHQHASGDDQHVKLLHDLCNFYWEADLGRSIIAGNLEQIRAIAGPDLHIQRYPYLRGVRPGKVRDAAPLHRDTYYGASPYEVSIVVPFTDMDQAGAMRVISGSHLAPDSEYPYTQTVSEDVVIRSPKHRLGFPYAPRLLDPALLDRAEPVPLKTGQVLVFPLSLVHGGGINTGSRTRFSSDIRVANSWAPVAWKRGVHDDYFVPLCSSAVTQTARRYEEVNRAALAAVGEA